MKSFTRRTGRPVHTLNSLLFSLLRYITQNRASLFGTRDTPFSWPRAYVSRHILFVLKLGHCIGISSLHVCLVCNNARSAMRFSWIFPIKIALVATFQSLIREFAHAWACCAFGGRIAHFQPLLESLRQHQIALSYCAPRTVCSH